MNEMPDHAEGGAVNPLLDQSVSGFAGGTFDVMMADKGVTDIPEFVQACPALKDVKITKALMQK